MENFACIFDKFFLITVLKMLSILQYAFVFCLAFFGEIFLNVLHIIFMGAGF